MALSKQKFAEYIRSFNFRELFNEMGWNFARNSYKIIIDDITYNLKEEAEKSGFKIFSCVPADHSPLPVYATRRKIEIQVTKLNQEHLIIFHDSIKHEQVWQLVVRQVGKPSRLTESRYSITQDPESLFQRAKGLIFKMEEEDSITIVDVTIRVGDNFGLNSDKVTKKFYEAFRKEHKAFIGFIKGIEAQGDKDWYASLMLNRLMFCYFIQKKGFLDNNINYLREKLKLCRTRNGSNKFYSFYRNFLLILFHEGLGNPDHAKLVAELGTIPYLNGGLFDEHDLERTYNDINIDDDAFDRVFNFFDQYDWHLDTRPDASGQEINPDVIGYIFEKYINDRADMGAYYTKEDITDYIGRNCIIPFIFDETERHYPNPFADNSEIWEFIRQSGDTYIYPDVKKGINPIEIWKDLPNDISAGMNPDQYASVDIRHCWNRPAPGEISLVTETWRELIERRKRYIEVRNKIESGKITHINDFITYNLNIRQFIQDFIENTEDHELIMHLYKTVAGDGKSRKPISILDPTCGSGAFLFAALNILEPIYEGLIRRMRAFTEDEDQCNLADKHNFKNKYSFFREVLQQVQNPVHTNLEYFIYKSIILRNLYGVDIMREAVEIAKLRLFLKLVSTVEANHRKPNLGLEPLPDIDFNIRSGNTLIGFANESELKKGLDYTFDGPLHKEVIEEKCDIVARAYNSYKDIQLRDGNDYDDFKVAKDNLTDRLKELNLELNLLLHKQVEGIKFDRWFQSHQPFHWFAEFYEILHQREGFDIIIGNPPYVEYSKVRKEYLIKGYETEKCGNLYPFIIERANNLLHKCGNTGMIIPLSAFCTQRMKPLVQIIRKNKRYNWISHFGWRPATLFEGVNIPLSIMISNLHACKPENKIFATEFNKWYQDKRNHVLNLLYFNEVNELLLHDFVIPKIGIEFNSIFKKLLAVKSNIGKYIRNSKNTIYYRNTGGLYWRIIVDFEPDFILNGNSSSSSTLATLNLETKEQLKISIALFNSNLFWVYYVAYSSFHHVNPIDLTAFPVSFEKMDAKIKEELVGLANQIMEDLIKNSILQTRIHKGGNNSQAQTFYPSLSKPIVDKIDAVIAKYFNFTFEELDRIINYDIKFRLQDEDDTII
jgi:hypothetical protein